MFLLEAVHSVQAGTYTDPCRTHQPSSNTDVTLAIHSIQAIIITAQSFMTNTNLKTTTTTT